MPNETVLTERRLEGEGDFGKVRAFLAGLFPRTPPGALWDVRMWDGCVHYSTDPWDDARRRERTRIFETPDGRIGALLLSEGDDELHPQVHPELRHLEPGVLARGEAIAVALGETRTRVLCWAYDEFRTSLLARTGYQRTERFARLYRRRLDARPLPPARVPSGYTIRPARADPAEHERLADLLNAAFQRDTHHAGETLGFRTRAPCFRPDLDLVAVAADGTLASYAPVGWDEANRRGIFEPVCTHPEHRRRGLAAALMCEGLRRARDRGATSLDVGTGDAQPAHALYESVGFDDCWQGWFWTKDLSPSASRPDG